MPYIKQDQRAKYNSLIDLITNKLLISKRMQSGPGELNYVISSIVWKLFDDDPNYAKGNELMGVLEAAKLEFYRRKLAPYEDQKIKENGDITSA